MNKEINLTKEGGHYYRALAIHWAITLPILPFVIIFLLFAIVNPFWFRERFMRWCENITVRLAHWRDKIKYRVYLGTDPKVWHALKDKNN